MIINISDLYKGEFLVNKFAYKFFSKEKKLYSLGNILSFRSGVEISYPKTIKRNDAINFCVELPNTNSFTGVCINRLLISGLANILSSEYLNSPILVDGTKIIVKQEFESNGLIIPEGILSFSTMNQLNETCMLYFGINIDAGPYAEGSTYSLKLSDADCIQFMQQINANFYGLLTDIFEETRK